MGTPATHPRSHLRYVPAAPDALPVVLRITPGGCIRGLWADAIDLGAIGRLHVHRASHVEFDAQRQQWHVRAAAPSELPRLLQGLLRCASGPVLYRSACRAEALAWEQRHFGPGRRRLGLNGEIQRSLILELLSELYGTRESRIDVAASELLRDLLADARPQENPVAGAHSQLSFEQLMGCVHDVRHQDLFR